MKDIDIKHVIKLLKDPETYTKIKGLPLKKIILWGSIFLVFIILFLIWNNIHYKNGVQKKAQELADIIITEQKNFYKEREEYFLGFNQTDHLRQVFYGSAIPIEEESPTAMFDSQMNIPSTKGLKAEGGITLQNTIFRNSFFLILNSKEKCVTMRYETGKSDETVYFIGFDEEKVSCQGPLCPKDSFTGNFCYSKGLCYKKNNRKETEMTCKGGHGKQIRTCVEDCNGGTCGEWSECQCDKGFSWENDKCVHTQTKEDCKENQCYNGVYCEDKDILSKDVDNGTCKRTTTCEEEKGWKYTEWDCTCISEDFCSDRKSCAVKPDRAETLELENDLGSCKEIDYKCKNNEGWIPTATSCICAKNGYYWDNVSKEAKCTPCTNAPENSTYTSTGGTANQCKWECKLGFQLFRSNCMQPTKQYLCADIKESDCTDDFAANRKVVVSNDTLDGVPCFAEENAEPILYHSTEKHTCKVCQCIGAYYSEVESVLKEEENSKQVIKLK